MVELQMEPEFYAWDWFVQLFMSLFSVPQSAILVDLLLSVNDGDLILNLSLGGAELGSCVRLSCM